MLRNDHKIMISQTVDGGPHWATIKLSDKQELNYGTMVTGSWKHTSGSHDNSLITFTSDNPQYYYYVWIGGPQGGTLQIGSKMGRASHKAGEDEIFQVLITCVMIRRDANGYFRAGSSGEGDGLLTYNVNPHFTKGAMRWSVVTY